MNEPPRKRRKTSSPPQAPPSPLRKPPRRPSFASPTKASLARNYPNLLPTRTPPRDGFRAQTKQIRTTGLDGSSTSPEHTEEGAEEEQELPTARRQKQITTQEGQRHRILLSSPSRLPPRATHSPPKGAPATLQKQFNRPEEEGLDIDGPNKRQQRAHLDPEVEKKRQEKARLQRDIEELEADVSRCTNEIAAEQERAAEVTLSPTLRAELNRFIAKIGGADAQDERSTPISSLILSFLPFSGLAMTAPRLTQTERPIASHRPVELKDPLPYLKIFTSFSCATQVDLPRGRPLSTSERVHQKQTITMTGPHKLLTAQVAVRLDCLTNEVLEMHVLRLPSWAERELGTFMRAKAHENDLGNACWAVDSFWDIVTKRAQYWHSCEKVFARLLPGRTDADTENTPALIPKPSTIARKALIRHLGRDMLILQDKHVLLKIDWRIVFDWTGEAESNVKVDCAVPAVWKEADASDIFRKIPETFDSLLRTRGAFEATRILVALLFPQ